MTAAALPCPHLFGEVVCSIPQPPPPSIPPPAPTQRPSCCHRPSSFYLVFYGARSDVVRFGPLRQSAGSTHRAHIDRGSQLMVIAGSLGQNQRPYLLPVCERRGSSRGGEYALYPLMLVLDGSADKTHNKNQCMHQYSEDPPPQELGALSEPVERLLPHARLNRETLSTAVRSVLLEKLWTQASVKFTWQGCSSYWSTSEVWGFAVGANLKPDT